MKANTLQPSPARRGAATTITSLAAAALLAAAGASSASAATFLDLRSGPGPEDRVEGEASEPGHERWIEILSMGFNADKGPNTTATRRGAPRLGDVVVVRKFDKASPKLQEAVLSGEVFPEMTVHIPLEGSHPGFVAILSDVVLTGYQVHIHHHSEQPTEEVSFYYNKIAFLYQPDNTGDGGPPVAAMHFDLLFGTNDPEKDDDGDGILNAHDNDDDNDEIDDEYELRYGLHPLFDDGDYDDDGDDKTNKEEWLAGTAADDPNSKFRIHSIAFDREGHCTVKVPTIGGRHYKLRGSFDLAAGRWIDFDEFDTPPGSEPGMMELALPPGAAAQFDRLFFSVEVSLPGDER